MPQVPDEGPVFPAGVSAPQFDSETAVMFRPGILCSAPAKLIVTASLLLCATLATAQHHGGHGITMNSTTLDRPDGVDERDSLKDFHHAVAVQATSQQIADFQEIIKATTASEDRLNALAKAGRTGREGTTGLDQALEDARTRTRKFQEGFTEPQKSGLRELTKRLEKADADLEQEAKRFDLSVQSESSATDVSAQAASLDKVLSDFSSAQLALGREMGITMASSQDVAFTLPKVRNQASIGGRNIAVAVSGILTQTAADGDLRTFRLLAAIDLFDLQQNITEILNARLYSNGCGVRLFVKRASLVAATPASSLMLQLHYERWSCVRLAGQSQMTELAESDGSVEMRLAPSSDPDNALHLTPEFKRIEATGAMADDLRSGDIGDTLRDAVSSSVLQAIAAGTNFRVTMPGALQNNVTLQSLKFEDPSSSGLKAVVAGQVRLTNDQVSLLAGQLNQTLSAQGGPAPAAAASSTLPTPQTK